MFLDYWERMKADGLAEPDPFGVDMKASQQGAEFRASNREPAQVQLANGALVQVWFSPNMPERRKPSKNKQTPPDLAEVYRRMQMAKDAILFLAFYPGQRGLDCMIGEAIEIGRKDGTLIVSGAVSSAQAMPNYVPKKKDKDGNVIEEGESPTTFTDGNVAIVRAARIDDRNILGDLGVEQLTARGTGALMRYFATPPA